MKDLLLRNRRWIAEVMHLALAAAALVASFLLRFEFAPDPVYRAMLLQALPWALGVKLAVFRAFGLHDLAWRFLGFTDLLRIAAANTAASAAAALALRAIFGDRFPRSIHVLDLLACLTFIAAFRAAVKMLLERRSPAARPRPARRVLIYGAGQTGRAALAGIQANPETGYEVQGFLDDDPGKRSMRIRGIRVLGAGSDLAGVARSHRAEQVWIALPSATGDHIASILERCQAAQVAAKRVPAFEERIEPGIRAGQIRDVRLEDLLGRPLRAWTKDPCGPASPAT